MRKIFNVSACCTPELHYMVDISERLQEIKAMVDAGQYFTINRARQYGKTTMMQALAELLEGNYVVVSLDFQMLSAVNFQNEQEFVAAFSREMLDNTEEIPGQIRREMEAFAEETARKMTLMALFGVLKEWCGQSSRKIVLMIDEVDSASNYQVFLDFLAQLRGHYMKRKKVPTFQSVILAGVYDVKNIRRKLRPEEGHRVNSPWNIAADFLVDMSFSAKDIAGMLEGYEADYHTGMDIGRMADLLYSYTSGYPYLVSRLCKLMDERIAGNGRFPDKGSAWTKEGFLEAVNLLLRERNTLFESLTGKLSDYPELRDLLYRLLFMGTGIPYSPTNHAIEVAEMFGFIKNVGGSAVISNRIFETVLYNFFLSEELLTSKAYDAGLRDKNQFLCKGHLNMRLILEKFAVHFHDVYGNQREEFLEEAGRRYFLLYLKPIINGKGNYYIEAETRDRERTDVIVDYQGEQFVIEMKLWRGDAYHARGEEQLKGYLDYYHLEKGYMLSFCFCKKKQIGVREVVLGDKTLIEAVV